MAESASQHRCVRFGEFEADLRTGELHKNGVRQRFSGQPFQVLSILLERPGEVVSREELQRRLWPDTFVDVERNLNTAINKIREILGDSAESPKFVETLPRRGYRFIAPVEAPSIEENGMTLAGVDLAAKRPMRPLRYLAAAMLLAGSAVAAIWLVSVTRVPRITGSTRLTFTGQVAGPHYPFAWTETFPGLATDGGRVYYTYVDWDRGSLAYVSTAGGDQVAMPLGFTGFEDTLRHISPDGSTLLVSAASTSAAPAHLWFVPTAGGGPRRIANIDGQDGAWSADGRRIVFAHGSELFVADSDGANVHKIATVSGQAFWLRWSPDSARIRFTLVDPKNGKSTLWECKTDGTDLHPLSLLRDDLAEECCGEWTKGGRYFLFRVFRNNHPDIWALRERGLSLFPAHPVRLTQGPLDSIDAVPSVDGRKLLTLEAQERSELHKLDLRTRQLSLYLPGFAATDVRRIPGTDAIVYIESHGRETKVWRCREDGSERLQLTAPPLLVFRIAPSPDGKQIALMGKMPDQNWRIYLVPSGGGALRALTSEAQAVADPTWSPDGSEIMFGAVPDWWPGGATMTPSVSIVSVKTAQTRVVPGSNNLWSPRWSPDGRYVIAMNADATKLMLFDFHTLRWTDLTSGQGYDFPEWYPTGEYVYVTEGSSNQTRLMRVRRADGKEEEVLDLGSLSPKSQVCWMITPPEKESLLVSCAVPNGDLYALDLDLP